MMHINDDQLILYHYREADEADAIREHLEGCAQCRTEYERLQKVLGAVDAAPVPERAEGYGEEVWNKLRPQLETQRQPERISIFTTRNVIWAVAVAASLLLAFFLGRYSPHEPPDQRADQSGEPSAGQPTDPAERVLQVAVGDHLERAQMVLLELANAEGNGRVDISSEQSRLDNLVADNRLYRMVATREGDHAVADLLDQIERVLVEIANAPSEVSPEEFESIRRDIEDRGLLFKVRVLGSKVRRQGKSASPIFPVQIIPDKGV